MIEKIIVLFVFWGNVLFSIPFDGLRWIYLLNLIAATALYYTLRFKYDVDPFSLLRKPTLKESTVHPSKPTQKPNVIAPPSPPS